MVAPSPKKQNAPSKDVTINNVWDKVEFTRARRRIGLAHEPKQPGELISVEGKGVLDPADYFTKSREGQSDLDDSKQTTK